MKTEQELRKDAKVDFDKLGYDFLNWETWKIAYWYGYYKALNEAEGLNSN